MIKSEKILFDSSRNSGRRKYLITSSYHAQGPNTVTRLSKQYPYDDLTLQLVPLSGISVESYMIYFPKNEIKKQMLA